MWLVSGHRGPGNASLGTVSGCPHGMPLPTGSLSGFTGPVLTEIMRMELSHLAGRVGRRGTPGSGDGVNECVCMWWEVALALGTSPSARTTWGGIRSEFLQAPSVLSECS